MENNKVVLYETAKSGYGDCIASLNNAGIQRLQHDVGETNRDVKDAEAEIRYAVKDAEANIRHDVLFEGQENQKTSLEVESKIKDTLNVNRNAVDAQFMALNGKICDVEKEVIKSGYEARIEALKTSERITDKLDYKYDKLEAKLNHGFEEVQEKLCDCCCEAKVNAATQTGLLNLLVSALNVK